MFIKESHKFSASSTDRLPRFGVKALSFSLLFIPQYDYLIDRGINDLP